MARRNVLSGEVWPCRLTRGCNTCQVCVAFIVCVARIAARYYTLRVSYSRSVSGTF